MGLKSAKASVVTAFNGTLGVSWNVVHMSTLDVVIRAPAETGGIFKVNGSEKKLTGKTEYQFQVEIS
jgi:hypothetical protein